MLVAMVRKSNIRFLVVACLFLLFGSYASRKGFFVKDDLIGTWSVGYRDTIADRILFSPSWRYEFYANGTYKENRKYFVAGHGKIQVLGDWRIQNDFLVLDENDTLGMEVGPDTLKMTISNRKLFWVIGEEGENGSDTVYMFLKKK
ncbi:MAG: hypothetical protein L6Q81_04080 [Bacteroidia bacterium]|nr:hypothetical protein [Bacteroidia bacterium]